VKAEKTTIPKVKCKSNQTQFSKENFKKPQTFTGMVFHVLGTKNDKKIGPSSFRPWETQAALKAPSFLQLSNHGWIPQRRAKALRKLKTKPRHKIAVLEMNVYLHPSMSCPHQ
jgi:Zn/Cd-binding protein ZinT